jgi:hypothetical protein
MEDSVSLDTSFLHHPMPWLASAGKGYPMPSGFRESLSNRQRAGKATSTHAPFPPHDDTLIRSPSVINVRSAACSLQLRG